MMRIRLYLPNQQNVDVLSTVEYVTERMTRRWWQRKRLIVVQSQNSDKFFHIDPDTVLSFSVLNKKIYEKFKKQN